MTEIDPTVGIAPMPGISRRLQRLAEECEFAARSYELKAHRARQAGLFVKFEDGMKGGRLEIWQTPTPALLDKDDPRCKPIVSTRIP